jgi:hypothetical protein
MAPFIAMMVIKARKTSLEAGQARYRAYFVNTTLYLAYKADTDTILQSEGYEDCIVSE